MNWRKIFSKKEDQKSGVYKSPDGKQIPNNAEFTGDKFPSKTGNPVKQEQSSWQEGNRLFKGDVGREKGNTLNSPLLDPKNRRERFKGLSSQARSRYSRFTDPRDWRSIFMVKKADTSVTTKPDGSLKIDITTPMQGQQPVQAPNQTLQTPLEPPTQTTPPQTTEQKEEKSAAEKKAFYESDPGFKSWFEDKSQDPNFVEDFHKYMSQAELYSETEPVIFEEWAYNKYQEEAQGVNKAVPTPQYQRTIGASKEPDTWLIDEKEGFRLEGRECKTHAGVRIMRGNEEIEFQRVAKQGHNWREIINQAEWQSKLDVYASAK